MSDTTTDDRITKTVDCWETLLLHPDSRLKSMELLRQGPDESELKTPVSTGTRILVGRSKDADLSVPTDDRLSKLHFSLECGTTYAILRDLGSTNGTYVNGERVKRIILADGDLIIAGSSIMEVRLVHETAGGAA